MTIGYYNPTNNKWFKFMQFSVMDNEHIEFLKANLPSLDALVVNIPSGHDSMWHPNDWTYQKGQLIGPNNQTTEATEITVEKVG